MLNHFLNFAAFSTSQPQALVRKTVGNCKRLVCLHVISLNISKASGRGPSDPLASTPSMSKARPTSLCRSKPQVIRMSTLVNKICGLPQPD